MVHEIYSGYTSIFQEIPDPDQGLQDKKGSEYWPDRRDGAVYQMSPELRLAVDVAVATKRPLLLRGEPGSGKSSLAAYLARILKWRYFDHVVTARTRASDLLYTYDAVRRLSDAQANRDPDKSLDTGRYVRPGPLWMSINPDSARGVLLESVWRTAHPESKVPADAAAGQSSRNAVLLIDEIDKADPDVPNDLLVPLGSLTFEVPELEGRKILPAWIENRNLSGSVLVIITTNEERDLPRAFLRRCVVHHMEVPNQETAFVDWLVKIAMLHLAGDRNPPEEEDKIEEKLLKPIARKLFKDRAVLSELRKRPPGIAEFLDAVRACRVLKVDLSANAGDGKSNTLWDWIERLTMTKEKDPLQNG